MKTAVVVFCLFLTQSILAQKVEYAQLSQKGEQSIMIKTGDSQEVKLLDSNGNEIQDILTALILMEEKGWVLRISTAKCIKGGGGSSVLTPYNLDRLIKRV